MLHLSETYESCVAVEYWGTVEDATCGIYVNSKVNTFLEWQSIGSCPHTAVMQKHVHEAQATLDIHADDFCFIRILEIGMANSEQAYAGLESVNIPIALPCACR